MAFDIFLFKLYMVNHIFVMYNIIKRVKEWRQQT